MSQLPSAQCERCGGVHYAGASCFPEPTIEALGDRLIAHVLAKTECTLAHAILAPASKPTVEGMRDQCLQHIRDFFKAEGANAQR